MPEAGHVLVSWWPQLPPRAWLRGGSGRACCLTAIYGCRWTAEIVSVVRFRRPNLRGLRVSGYCLREPPTPSSSVVDPLGTN